ncbi:hypothetical protein NEIMUCOT_04858 [Neisseria mucosa ATCC 25996]|uniref:Uncharacterized protein n=1 Tax=Neisseria mucosa (strain ATCC 25996 / DSM 4631 / NCTC 10774 / M26) TaxID=546266 RepID=D2ZW65_NEIM2|nr:hypothetical protein NEIMUCOT_04858 [Neisseria mucosa ATCC 25996]
MHLLIKGRLNLSDDLFVKQNIVSNSDFINDIMDEQEWVSKLQVSHL